MSLTAKEMLNKLGFDHISEEEIFIGSEIFCVVYSKGIPYKNDSVILKIYYGGAVRVYYYSDSIEDEFDMKPFYFDTAELVNAVKKQILEIEEYNLNIKINIK